MTIGTCIAALINAGLLTALRDLGRMPSHSMDDMRRIAKAQVETLRQGLPEQLHQIPARISSLIPSITVEVVAGLPVPGVAYWADHRWHIHVRQEDPADVRAFTTLYQLKRIIDQPLRRQPGPFTDTDWDALAATFARHALTANPRPPATVNRKEERV
jgi:hypothetical protein